MKYTEYLDEINARYKDYPANRPANLAANAQAVEVLMGLCGEVGEIADLLKKHWMYDKPLDQRKLLEEFGDVFHYFLRLADMYHFSLPVIMESNATKLREQIDLFKELGMTMNEALIKQGERE
jgi:dimeric dUTPase (all-alpha-NTP-PPase superfamily)